MKLPSTLLFFIFSSILLSQSADLIAEMEMKSRISPTHSQPGNLMDGPDIINVWRYELHFDLDPSASTFSGTSGIRFTVLEPVSEVTFDADNNLIISEIRINNNPTTSYTRTFDAVTIDLNQTFEPGIEIMIDIDYTSTYADAGSMFKETQNGNPLITTLSEPFGASSWWIGIDDLNDKAEETDIFVTHPSNLKVGSNGMLISVTPQGDGTSITHWHHSYPIPAYLISLAMTNYAEYNNSANISGTVVPVINYVYPSELNSETMSLLDAVPSYMEFFSELVGDYPYKNEKYGHSQWNWGGGMEHATMSSQVHFGTSLTAHELAHQWFGDKITCGSWSDIWLNEGFATYFEGLLRRNLYGEEFFTEWKYVRNYYIMTEMGGSVYIPEAEAFYDGRIFDSRLSYYKGAMVLHMLRYTLGDVDFYQAIRNYLQDPQLTYGFATTPDLQQHFETQSGRDLDEFFADWVYGEGFPIFDLQMDYHPDGNSAVLTVNQTSSHPSVDFFETEFDVLLTGTNGETELRRFTLTQNGQSFNIENLPFELDSYTFNPHFDILGYVENQTLGTEEITNAGEFHLKLYPNPATDFVHVFHKDNISKISVFDTAGKLVLTQEVNDKQADIFVQQLPNGSYMLQAQTEQGTESVKFLKK